jgi:hypothetical protein
MERGGQVAQNLRALYEYMMNRLALANGTNDVAIVAECRPWSRKSRAAGTKSSRTNDERQGTGAARPRLMLSQELLAAADQGDLQHSERLDAERLRLLESLRIERDHLSGGDWSVIRQISELNDRAIGFTSINAQQGKGIGYGRGGTPRAVAAYSTTRAALGFTDKAGDV